MDISIKQKYRNDFHSRIITILGISDEIVFIYPSNSEEEIKAKLVITQWDYENGNRDTRAICAFQVFDGIGNRLCIDDSVIWYVKGFEYSASLNLMRSNMRILEVHLMAPNPNRRVANYLGHPYKLEKVA